MGIHGGIYYCMRLCACMFQIMYKYNFHKDIILDFNAHLVFIHE